MLRLCDISENLDTWFSCEVLSDSKYNIIDFTNIIYNPTINRCSFLKKLNRNDIFVMLYFTSHSSGFPWMRM